ncbi:MAG: alpha-amylase family glycosyl hydrolase, partial [Myxococcales bacterium]|nr:alpha-amylase family glycosyl hydrolase [Myxococcales bacterium]
MRSPLLALLIALMAGCSLGEHEFSYPQESRDGGMAPPAYRTRCAGDGASGTSGTSGTSGVGDGGCADGGVMPIDAGPPPPPCNEITFAIPDAGYGSVWLTGTFTSWAETPALGALEMTLVGGEWSLVHLVEPVGSHEYKLIVDGTTWITDPSNPRTVSDGFGGFNSVIDVCVASCGDLNAFDWRDTVMYFVMIDRFANADGRTDPVPGASDGDASRGPSGQYEGGDLAGVTGALPYLAGLGVTAVWLSAPYENRDSAGAAIDPAADPHL